MDPRISVVIPYFQRKSGLLERAVASVLAQSPHCPLEVLVVDDASPLPAARELAALLARPLSAPAAVRIVERANGGPGAARNSGLAALHPAARTVAFLDSDDWWTPEHLPRALRAIEGERADVYVCNWKPLEADVDAYTHFQKLDLAQHAPVAGLEDAQLYSGDFFVQELTRPIGRLSTMVFRRERFGDLRFDERLRNAFEDRLFRLDMARRQPRIVFSTRVECLSGEGVNVFSGQAWGTPGRLDVLSDEIEALRIVRSRFELSAAERKIVLAGLRDGRREFLANWMHLAAGRSPQFARLLRQLRRDPSFAWRMPMVLADWWRSRAA